jgi:hypothetical protein
MKKSGLPAPRENPADFGEGEVGSFQIDSFNARWLKQQHILLKASWII